ncbi:MAG TPA: HAD hydrolase-like protein [Granulicella sp.]|nr:HAD hydrolase-like protein [Granulicella sp.]
MTATPPELLVFDLDGTLIDSRIDLCNSINAMLEHLGKPRLPEPVIASYIGDGASMLVRRALGDPEGDAHDEQFVAEALALFLDYYRVHKLDHTYVYPGVFESLEAIRRRFPALPMAILTNKPVVPSRAICEHFGLDRYFFQNYGGNSFHTKKPDPHGLLALIAEAAALAGRAIEPANVVMIGDSDVDILTARNCGTRSVGCTYGLAPNSLAAAGPDALVNSPKEWPSLFA